MTATINIVRELSAGESEAKICLKLVAKIPYVHIYNLKIITSVNSPRCFLNITYLANTIAGEKVVTEQQSD